MEKYLYFIRCLENEIFLSTVRRDNIPLLPPFDIVVTKVLELSNPDWGTILNVAKLHLHKDMYDMLMGLNYDLKLGLQAYRYLADDSIESEIIKVSTAPTDKEKKFERIEHLLKNRSVRIPEPQAKTWDELESNPEEYMFEFGGYKISRGKISLVASFAGIGKTTTSLCFANNATCAGLKTLLICLKDWSESELKRKSVNMAAKENLTFAVYGDCTLNDIDFEIATTKPDVVVIDALTDIDVPFSEKYHKQLGEVAADLRSMGVKYDCHVFTTHQARVLETVLRPEHLRDSKSDLLQPLDLCWGLGASSVTEPQKVLSTLKVRHQESQAPHKIVFDYDNLDIRDLGVYNEVGRAGAFYA